MKESSTTALTELGIDDANLFDLIQTEALEWAKDRAAEMVGMQYNAAGDLVINPDPKWAITENTRDGLRSMITSAYENGIDVTQLGQQIEDSYLFSAARSETIARTELAKADTQATLIAWKESGVVTGKKSLLGSEHDEEAFDCDCAEIEDEGVIDLDDLFLSEYDAPPYHPNCVCVLVTQVLEESGELSSEE